MTQQEIKNLETLKSTGSPWFIEQDQKSLADLAVRLIGHIEELEHIIEKNKIPDELRLLVEQTDTKLDEGLEAK